VTAGQDRAAVLVARAIRRGELVRPAHCEQCSATGRAIQAHHDDYNRPLDVRWLCRSCHMAWHGKNKPVPMVGAEPPRLVNIRVCMTAGERELIIKAARSRGKTVSAWIRETALALAHGAVLVDNDGKPARWLYERGRAA